MLSRLIDAHPMLFQGRRPPTHSMLPEGWFGVADALLREIERSVDEEEIHELRIACIAPNNGRLDVILSGTYSEALEHLIASAGSLSEVTCQECGDVPAEFLDGEVELTLCEFCQFERRLRAQRARSRPYY